MQQQLWREIARPFQVKRRGTAIAIAFGFAAASVVGAALVGVVEILEDWFY